MMNWINSKFFQWLAGKLPRWLVLWCAIRVTATGKTDDGLFIVPNDVSAWELINKWQEYCHERVFRWHSQNLTDDWGNKPKGPKWKHGRAWFHLGRLIINPYWCFGARFCHAKIHIGSGDTNKDLEFSLGIPWVGLFNLTFGRILPRWLTDGRWRESTIRPGEMWWDTTERVIGVSIHDGTIWFSLWENPMEWSSKNPKWWSFNFNPADFFLGYAKHTKRTVSNTPAFVTLPEGQYPVKVEIFESTWKRPRWPKVTRMVRADVDCGEKGIPSHAGKGENSWDLDDDALFSMTCPAQTVDEAVMMVADSILKDRKKYGMPELPQGEGK